MPIYEYRCTSCGHLFEVMAGFNDPAPAACESCGESALEKVLHAAAVHFKGSGFYATDYGKGKKRTGQDSGSSSSESASGSESGGASSGASSSDSGGSSSSGSGSSASSSSSDT